MKIQTTLISGLAFAFLLAASGCSAGTINEETNRSKGDPNGTNYVDRPTDAEGLGGIPSDSDSTSMDVNGANHTDSAAARRERL